MEAGASPVMTSNCSGPQARAKVIVVVPAPTLKVVASSLVCGHGQNTLFGIE
jgi:hypothetical protein